MRKFGPKARARALHVLVMTVSLLLVVLPIFNQAFPGHPYMQLALAIVGAAAAVLQQLGYIRQPPAPASSADGSSP